MTSTAPTTQHTYFTRSLEHKIPTLSLGNAIGAIGHLLTPLFTYQLLYNDLGINYISQNLDQYITVTPLSSVRKDLYFYLHCYYCVRWFIGMMTQNSFMSVSDGLGLSVAHFIVHEFLGYIGPSMGIFAIFGAAPEQLTTQDYIATFLMLLAGFLQHFSEFQRYLFKRNPKNKGKIHTGGLFKYARGINHTGHCLRDFACVVFAPGYINILLFVSTLRLLMFQIVPETVNHMKTKYGEQYEKYEKQTPYMFIPGLW